MLGKLNSYLELIRFYRPTGSLLLFFPILFTFLFLDPNFNSWRILLVFALASFVMRSAGCVINDIWDVKFDKQVKRTKNRPLANGSVSKVEAFVLLISLLFLGLFLGLSLQLKTLIFISFLLVPIAIYPLCKRFFKYPQFFLGATFNTGALVASYELTGAISYHIWVLYFACIFWTVGYDTIYAYQDREDDLELGLNSTTISFKDSGKKIVVGCYLLFLLGIFFIGIEAGFRLIFFILLQSLTLYIMQQLINLDLEEQESCAAFFKHNSYYAAIISVILIISNYLS